ncbi:MAG: transcription termination/antitermination NusG family protein [Verrucomicrobiota bacterium]
MNANDFSTQAWYCLRAQPKREHIAAEFLRKRDGFEVLMPRIAYRKDTQRGVMRWVEPMFPCYFFAKLNLEEDLFKVRSSPGVSGVVHFNGKFVPVDETSMEWLREQAGEHEILEISDEMVLGDEVKIVEGAMRGTIATIQRVLPSKRRVEVLLDFLGNEIRTVLDWKSVLIDRDAMFAR